MKSKIYLFIVILTAFVACAKNQGSGAQTFLLPWPDENGNYTLQKVNIHTLSNMNEVSGGAAQLYVSPGVSRTQMDGVLPNAQFAKVDGAWWAKDVLSQELIIAYAHLERLQKMDQDLGVADVLTWPRRMGLQVISQSAKGPVVNNAAYDYASDSTMIYPYENLPNLPTSVNGGILAHEHFHSLFRFIVIPRDFEASMHTDQLLMSPKLMTASALAKVKIQKNNYFFLRAIDEGYADVWASFYTKDANFIGKTFASQTNARSLALDSTPVQFNAKLPVFFRAEQFSAQDMGWAYVLGTQYARMTLRILESRYQNSPVDKTLQSEKAMWLAQNFLPILQGLRTYLTENFNSVKWNANYIFSALYPVAGKINADECAILSQYAVSDSSNPVMQECSSKFATQFPRAN